MDKHAAHFGGLVGATHPAFDPAVGASSRAGAGQNGRQITRAKTDQGIVGVEGGDDQFAHFTIGHRVARARTHDFDDHAFIHDQAFAGSGFVSDQAHVCRGVALVGVNAAR